MREDRLMSHERRNKKKMSETKEVVTPRNGPFLICRFCDGVELEHSTFRQAPERMFTAHSGDLIGHCPKCFYWQYENVVNTERRSWEDFGMGMWRNETAHKMSPNKMILDETGEAW
jgi:hypothetical protein